MVPTKCVASIGGVAVSSEHVDICERHRGPLHLSMPG